MSIARTLATPLTLTFALGIGALGSGCPSETAMPDAATSVDAVTADAPASDRDTGESAADAASDSGVVDPCAAGACGPCDTDLAIDDDDATHAARAMGVCSGLASAAWELPDGTSPPSSVSFTLGHGLLDDFGVVDPLEGTRLLALSTGTARAPTDPGWSAPTGFDKGYTHDPSAGFPLEAPACPSLPFGAAYDGVALVLALDVPAGAHGFQLRLKHHTFEFPSYVCNASDDMASVVITPAPAGAPASGHVTLDPTGNPLSVNSSFVDVCACSGGPPCATGSRTYACAAGDDELADTGFDDASQLGAATRWLELRVPATAGARVEIRISAWDSGDGLLDSTLLADGFRWLAESDAPSSTELRVAAP